MSRSLTLALLVSTLGLLEAGCDSSTPPAPPKGEMSGSMEKGKTDGGMMEKSKTEGGMMEKDKTDGGMMDKGKMEATPK